MTIEFLATMFEELAILFAVMLLGLGLVLNALVNLLSFFLSKIIEGAIAFTKQTIETLKQPRTFP